MAKIVSLFKAIVWELCNKFFSYIFSFCKIKGCYYWKCKFYNLYVQDPASGLLQIGYKLENDNDVTTFQKSINLFDFTVFLLSSLLTDPNFMSISWLELRKFLLIKDWPENLEIVNTPAWVLPSILRLGQVRNTEFGRNVSNKMLLNALKCQGYCFYYFWVIKGKPTGRGKITPPPRLMLNIGVLVIIFYGRIFWKYL